MLFRAAIETECHRKCVTITEDGLKWATVMMVDLFVNGKFSVRQLFEHILPVREIKYAYNNYGDTLTS